MGLIELPLKLPQLDRFNAQSGMMMKCSSGLHHSSEVRFWSKSHDRLSGLNGETQDRRSHNLVSRYFVRVTVANVESMLVLSGRMFRNAFRHYLCGGNCY